ncbi:MAG: Gfo/Idh/MocA family oxidoreductase, partial [Oscillospiraceae bacterium]|nr:Gfo/Idh/MocA family oxidoreductase [Oscillospiraceae bacterium]
MTEYGVGIVGMGFMGRTHAYAHRTLPYYYPGLPWTTRLVAACNRSPAAVEEARDRLGFERATTDFSDLLNDERIRLVHICTPNA